MLGVVDVGRGCTCLGLGDGCGRDGFGGGGGHTAGGVKSRGSDVISDATGDAASIPVRTCSRRVAATWAIVLSDCLHVSV